MVIEFLNRELPLYGIFFWLGILLAGAIAIFIAKKNKIESFDILISGIYTMFCAIVGSKILYFIVSWSDIMRFIKVAPEHGYTTLDIISTLMQGGFVFYGGFIGGVLGLFLYTKIFKKSFSDFAGVYAVVLPFGHSLGRVGCFFGGCCYGIEYDGPFSHVYKALAHTDAPIGVPLFPVQLLEALCLFILFIALLIIFLKSDNRNSLCICTYALSYAVIRFSLEFLRGDVERGGVGPVSTSQIISILIFIASIAILIFNIKHKQKDNV